MNFSKNGIVNNIAKFAVWVSIGIRKLFHSQTVGGDIQNVKLPKTNKDIDKFFAILASLQAYAELEFSGDGLSPMGHGMKAVLLDDLFKIGFNFEMSKGEITKLIFQDVLVRA